MANVKFSLKVIFLRIEEKANSELRKYCQTLLCGFFPPYFSIQQLWIRLSCRGGWYEPDARGA